MQEYWHIYSFNKNAIAEGWGNTGEDLHIKAVATKVGCFADAEIWKGDGRVYEVQFKRYANAKSTARAFAKAKYKGMMKVGPSDQVADAQSRFEACMSCEGVSSDPCSRTQLDEMAEKGEG